MRILKILTLLWFPFFISANAQVKEVAGFQNPESVIAFRGKLFVSNLGVQLDPTSKDGDGYISMLSRKEGKMIEEKFLTGLNSPKGMIVRCGKLVVADVDKVVVFRIKTKKKIWEGDLSKEGIVYANDLAKSCGGVFVTATDKNAIYKVCMSGKVKKLPIKVELPGANGLAKGCCKLYIANYGDGTNPNGNFGKINRCSKKFKMMKGDGAYDGIVKVCHHLVLTDWVNPAENKGRLMVYNLYKKKLTELSIGRPIDGPADLFYDCHTKTFWIPAMRENKILGVSYKTIKKAGF